MQIAETFAVKMPTAHPSTDPSKPAEPSRPARCGGVLPSPPRTVAHGPEQRLLPHACGRKRAERERTGAVVVPGEDGRRHPRRGRGCRWWRPAQKEPARCGRRRIPRPEADAAADPGGEEREAAPAVDPGGSAPRRRGGHGSCSAERRRHPSAISGGEGAPIWSTCSGSSSDSWKEAAKSR